MDDNKLKQLAMAILFVAMAVPGGALVFIRFDYTLVQLCTETTCMEIARSVAEFMIKFPLLFGLALADMIGGLGAGMYKFVKVFTPMIIGIEE